MTTVIFHSTGTLSLNGIEISSKTTKADFQLIFPTNEISETRSSRVRIYRANPASVWMNYRLESCAIEIGSSCKGVGLHFVGPETSHIDSVTNCLLTKHLRNVFQPSGTVMSKSLVQFDLDASRIDVLYDIKLGAPSVKVAFKT